MTACKVTGDSRTPRHRVSSAPCFVASMTQTLEAALQVFAPALPLAVAYSGGADSSALLHLCAQRWPGQVVAFHVNHQLQEAASQFERQCQDTCEQLQVPLRTLRVNAKAAPGQSPEDAARRARYEAFRLLAQEERALTAIKSIATAQHAGDQVETVLLALSRGAGVAGLSAMPQKWLRDGLTYHRPFLRVSGVEIRSWLAKQGIDFVEDPTNTDQRYTRNRIRAQLMPALRAVFPQVEDTFARSAQHAAQAQEVLDEVAAQDLLAACQAGENPVIAALQDLSKARCANVLRFWLKSHYGVIASTAQLNELLRQIVTCTTRGHRIDIKVGQGFVRRSKSHIAWYNARVLL
jgi:tRNA(Ile)-lysidine synthase